MGYVIYDFRVNMLPIIPIPNSRYYVPNGNGNDLDEYLTDLNGVYRKVSSSSSSTDELVKVSSNDTTAGYLNGKLIAGTNISLVENNNGGNETLTVNFTGSAIDTTAWHKLGDAGTIPGINFLGTIDSKSLEGRTNNIRSFFVSPTETYLSFGYEALLNAVDGLDVSAIAIGTRALYSFSGAEGNNIAIGNYSLENNDIGNNNLGIGHNSLQTNTIGNGNVGIGMQTLTNNLTGGQSVAIGNNSMQSNYNGGQSVAVGYNSLFTSSAGIGVVAIGYEALYFNLVSGLTAVGYQALHENTTGLYNTGLGYDVLYSNKVGIHNTGIGAYALLLNLNNWNTAIGSFVLSNNTTGEQNTGVGGNALLHNIDGFKNTAIGAGAMENNISGYQNAFLGHDSGLHNTLGWHNNGVGWLAGSLNEIGNYNNFLGTSSGRGMKNGNYNIFIGHETGYNASQKINAENTIVIGAGSFSTIDNETILGNTAIIKATVYGELFLPTVNNDNAETKLLTWNSGTKNVEYRDASTIITPTPTWQQTLTAGSTLTGSNTIIGGGFDFAFTTVGIFVIDSITTNIGATSGGINLSTTSTGIIELNSSNDIHFYASSGILDTDFTDIHLNAASKLFLNLPSNNTGYFLKNVNGATGEAEWAAIPAGFSDPMTTRGDIIIRNSSNVTARLGIGANTYVLTSDGIDIAWQPATVGANVALSNLSGVAINTTLLPGSNDGAGLGSGTLAFSDLFLASGGVINWNNGNQIITHSANQLAFTGAGNIDVKIVTTGTNTPKFTVDASAGGQATIKTIGTFSAAIELNSGVGSSNITFLGGGNNYIYNSTNSLLFGIALTSFNDNANNIDFQIKGDTDVNMLYGDASADSVGFGLATPTAKIHIAAGTTTKAPLKFTSGTLLTTAEAGAIEFLTDKFYATITTGAARHTLVTLESAIQTFTNDIIVPDEVYDATAWNGNLEVPTKNAIRDKIESMSTGSGITRTQITTSSSITLGATVSTDYIYYVTGAHTLSMPSPNNNRYTVKNNHSANITIDTAGAENIEGAASISISPGSSVDISSDGTDWWVI